MKEVWKDMNLSSLNEHQAAASSSDYRSVMLQDFLARSPYDSPSSQDHVSSSSLSPASPLVTALSLGNVNGISSPPFPSLTNNNDNPFPSSPSFPYKRHFPDSHLSHPSTPPLHNLHNPTHTHISPFGAGAGGERHKRMIKNRESAARSRARKQAYTNELEEKVDYLTRENERLKKQQEEWAKALASDKKKNALFRTSTAPF